MVLENAGPPANRINYIIVGDGYTTAELDTTYRAHLENMLDYVYGFHCDEHRHAYPDPMKIRAGFEVLLECLEFPSVQGYLDTFILMSRCPVSCHPHFASPQ